MEERSLGVGLAEGSGDGAMYLGQYKNGHTQAAALPSWKHGGAGGCGKKSRVSACLRTRSCVKGPGEGLRAAAAQSGQRGLLHTQ